MTRSGRILVIDDDVGVLTAARLLLKRHFAVVQTESDPTKLPDLLDAGFDVVLLDMNFARGADSGAEGLAWLAKILEIDPGIVVVLMTAYGDVSTAVNAIKAGATDFVLKPWQNEKLVATVTAALSLRDSRDEVGRLRSRERELVDAASGAVQPVIGNAAPMRHVFEMVRRAAPTDANVLILGESGVGKELVARLLHQQSRRAAEVFMSVDLGSVSQTLFESELFGHRRGAFTDAREERAGRFQAASRGTLFLDEIGNLPLHLQGKLLSALEQRTVTPLGSDRALPIDVRLVSATNKPLAALAGTGEFREDLLYRINTVEIRVPPLRERVEDIAPLFDHFVEIYARKYNLPPKRLSRVGLKRLEAYAWPGNVRELRHAVERALIMSDAPMLDAHDFLLAPERRSGGDGLKLDDYNLETVENRVIQAALEKHGGNVSRAARELGITRASLYRRMEKYGL
ncbi:MAG TPA: sigma-54 dependent transcriptional regulator [Gammaproteobacteria bacterium]|nr:sigma-54 dependent transcriptional regulator [Gammaproteobacteria bacterium]